MARRRQFLQRTRDRQRQENQAGKGFNPASMIRLSGFGAALIVALAVFVGFTEQGETVYDGPWGLLQRLTSPLFFGINALEILTILVVAAFAWRVWVKMQANK